MLKNKNLIGCHKIINLSALALGGHLDILKWARVHGCPWNYWTCHHAFAEGHLEVLKWAKENGCPSGTL